MVGGGGGGEGWMLGGGRSWNCEDGHRFVVRIAGLARTCGTAQRQHDPYPAGARAAIAVQHVAVTASGEGHVSVSYMPFTQLQRGPPPRPWLRAHSLALLVLVQIAVTAAPAVGIVLVGQAVTVVISLVRALSGGNGTARQTRSTARSQHACRLGIPQAYATQSCAATNLRSQP